DAVQSSAVALTAPPVSTDKSAEFVGAIQSALAGFQQLDGDVRDLRSQVDSGVADAVTQVNGLLKQINDLNGTIVSENALGRGTAGAESQRAAALEQLGSLVKITVRSQADGRVSIDTASGVALLDRLPRELSYTGSTPDGSPSITVRFTDASGRAGAPTGDVITSGSVGGTLGGLIELRNTTLPGFEKQIGTLFDGFANTLNTASNAATSVPAPATLIGRQTTLGAGDALHFTGAATFAVTANDGTLVASAKVDFSALGANATVGDAINAINAGLGGAGTATLNNGVLTIAASGSGNGVVIAQDPTSPSNRAGQGFSQFFGLNDIVQSATAPLAATGFTASDQTGFGVGQATDFALRDTNGRVLATTSVTAAAGQTFGDVVTALNSGPMAKFGSFALDASGRLGFTPNASGQGATMAVTGDNTSRNGSGQSLSMLTGLASGSGISSAALRPDIATDPSKLQLATYQNGTAVGGKAIGALDTSGATTMANLLGQAVTFGDGSSATVSTYAAQLASKIGAAATTAKQGVTTASARHDDAVTRRDSISGVNVDEELTHMVALQNSYSAAARVMTTASQMYDTLIQMVS
ncbi:MAG: FlgK family flagellar hook-associated protein, partial [Sphingomonas sp.]